MLFLALISKQLPNYFYCFFVVLFFRIVQWLSFSRVFYDIYVVVIENFYKFFFFSYSFFTFFSQPNFCIVSKKLFASKKCFNLVDTDVFKTSSGRLKKVTTSCDQTRRRQEVSSWRRPIHDILKTFDLQYLEDVCKAMPL